MFTKQYKIISAFGLAIFVLFFIFSQTHKNILPPQLATVKTQEVKISIFMAVGGEIIPLSTYAGASLYDVLLSANESGQIMFSGKNYPALGFFISDINSLHNGNGKYLFYYINGKEASVGVSSYFPEDGDVIEWKLK